MDDPAFPVPENLIVYKGSCITGTVSEDVFQFAVLVSAHIDDAVSDVDTGVIGLNRSVDTASFHVSSYDVVAHLQRKYLFVVEYVFDDDDRTDCVVLAVVFRFFLFLCSS